MGLTADQLKTALDTLAAREPAFAAALARVGYPPERIRERGYATLLRTIIGQQVSVKAAASIWNKFEAVLGGDTLDPSTLLAKSDEELRSAGLSRQKVAYVRSLAEEVASGRLDFERLPVDDEEAIKALTGIKGIGRWSAEIYLLFAEGRTDIWPAGDLAVQIEIHRILGREGRPSERETRALAEDWRPHRGAVAVFAWHHYMAEMEVI
ncbi:DNA-3-methyladenine glycosylase family protein [Sphingomonas japonica]|uniref:DNA-3-methyladenine glycosylase II n=1 Tax=Sphingomonas japonica TaxID=511662 RepID=A0ABX0U090_9SPHN|nr:DNA-3-methyladenine glycosylase [Sphingomonas japonica]NIJ23908.1 DNA-3-methyladenine glycosylase II [Sphingomonas japonica]